jgi:hypothetical protein
VRQEYPRTRFDDSWRDLRRARLLAAAPLTGGGSPDGVRLQVCVEVVLGGSTRAPGQAPGPVAGEERALYGGPVTLVREGGAYRVGPSSLRRVAAC